MILHLLCNGNLKILDFFDFFVFFKLYFDHVADCIFVWKFFTIFFDPRRINKKNLESIGRFFGIEISIKCSTDAPGLIGTILKPTFFWDTLYIKYTHSLFCLKLRNFPGSEEKRVSSTHYLDWKHYKVTMGLMPWQSEMSPHCFMDRLKIFFIYPTWVKENCKKKITAKKQFEKYEKFEKIQNH